MTDKDKLQYEMTEIAKDLISRSEELCKLDSFVGDGDHGISIRKGFGQVLKSMGEPSDTVEAVFTKCGDAVLDSMGGAIGPIFASVFMGFAMASEGKESLTTADWKSNFDRALEVVMTTGGAKPGDRTLVDTLNAAVEGFRESEGRTDKEIWESVTSRAWEGAQKTKEMQALKGRARYLAEKSIGYVDAGSMSMFYFIDRLADIEKREA